jgi:hypothetical protein
MRKRIDEQMGEMEIAFFREQYDALQASNPDHDMLRAVTLEAGAIFAEQAFFDRYEGKSLTVAVPMYFVGLKIANGSW